MAFMGVVIAFLAFMIWRGFQRDGQRLKFKEEKAENEKKYEEERRQRRQKHRKEYFDLCNKYNGIPVIGYGYMITCLKQDAAYFVTDPEPDLF